MQSLAAMVAAESGCRGTCGKVLAMRSMAAGAGSQMPLARTSPGSCCRIAVSSRSPMMPAPMSPIAMLPFVMFAMPVLFVPRP